MLIDEGFANIDIYYQIKFMEYLHTLSAEKDKTILVVIHDINFMFKTIDRVVVFKEGSIYNQGRTKEVLTEKMMKDVFNVNTEVLHNGIDYKSHNYTENI